MIQFRVHPHSTCGFLSLLLEFASGANQDQPRILYVLFVLCFVSHCMMLCVSIYEDFCFARFQPTHLLRPKMCSGSFGRVDHTIRKAEQNVARVN